MVEILEMLGSQAEFKVMLWEMFAQVFTVYAAVFTGAVLTIYLLLIGREAAK